MQQHFACRQQFTATQRCDDGLVQFSKDAIRVRTSVFTQRLPLVHSQDGAIKQRSDDLITLPVAIPQHECEGCVPFIFIEFRIGYLLKRPVGDLDRNPANFQPLTPLSFLERAASVFPDHTAIIHGPLHRNYAEFYARSRRLAGALAKHGIKQGDTVSAVLANTPAMLECHYGVPMAGAVLNTINTRLDAAVVAFQIDHAESKVLIADREFSKLVKEALALARPSPW